MISRGHMPCQVKPCAACHGFTEIFFNVFVETWINEMCSSAGFAKNAPRVATGLLYRYIDTFVSFNIHSIYSLVISLDRLAQLLVNTKI